MHSQRDLPASELHLPHEARVLGARDEQRDGGQGERRPDKRGRDQQVVHVVPPD